jgi:hypothetical protein
MMNRGPWQLNTVNELIGNTGIRDARRSGGMMKTAALIFSGFILAWAAYSLGPDLRRYARMRAM